jgi:prevent-host-death family protein
MRMMTASEASRNFSTVLDRTERGETTVITRGGRRVAMLSPVPAGNGAALLDLVSGWRAPDDPGFVDDLAAVRESITLDDDPWSRD